MKLQRRCDLTKILATSGLDGQGAGREFVRKYGLASIQGHNSQALQRSYSNFLRISTNGYKLRRVPDEDGHPGNQLKLIYRLLASDSQMQSDVGDERALSTHGIQRELSLLDPISSREPIFGVVT